MGLDAPRSSLELDQTTELFSPPIKVLGFKEATRTESPKSASELGCRPRLSAARLAPDCPDPPGERIPGVSYFGCSPASRAKLLATLSPREDVWPGRSARAPGLPLHTECSELERQRNERCGSLSLLIVLGSSRQPEPPGPLTPLALGSLPRARSH